MRSSVPSTRPAKAPPLSTASSSTLPSAISIPASTSPRVLAGAKNLAEIVELQSAFLRHQFDVFANQASEIRALTTKIAADTTEPIKAQVTRSMDTIRKSS